MPYGHMDIAELSKFLGIDARQIDRMAKRGEIPCQKVGGQLRFNRAELTEWLQQEMGSMDKNNLANMEAGITAHRDTTQEECIVSNLLTLQSTTTNLGAKTKNSVLRELAALAQETGQVYDTESLLEAIIRREELCSTAMEGGLAIPHPRRPLPYAIAEPILVVARTTQGIGFGAPDGRLSDLFFLTCSQDDRHHLHILARLCRMLQDKQLLIDLREVETNEEMIDLLKEREAKVIKDSL